MPIYPRIYQTFLFNIQILKYKTFNKQVKRSVFANRMSLECFYLINCNASPYFFHLLSKTFTIIEKLERKRQIYSPNTTLLHIIYSTPAASLLARVMADLTHAHKKTRTRCTLELPFYSFLIL